MTIVGACGLIAGSAMAQSYPTARPYPGVNTPTVRAPAEAPRRASVPAPAPAATSTQPAWRGPATPRYGFTGAAAQAANWEIGPIIRGRSRSPGMPLRPTQLGGGADGAWSFDFPGPRASDGHVHYVTMPTRSLAGADRITMTYRIDAAPGTRFVPQEQPDTPATMSLYFQVAGDNWTARDQYRFARWYAPREKVVPVTPGTHTVSIGLDENWTAVVAFKRDTAPQEFERAKADAARIGFVFGGGGGRGHGVFATEPARFTLLDFRVE